MMRICGLSVMISLNLHRGAAQVSFEVSNSSVVSNYTSGVLSHALEKGSISPEEVLKVYVEDLNPNKLTNRTSILGTYMRLPGKIIFNPLVPFSESLPYLAVFSDTVSYQFKFKPPVDRSKTALLKIIPATDSVPANLLKIYLKFSRPMREGEVYQRVRLSDEHGNPLNNPFVPLQPELWDSSGQRITLWLDPGRVKRALGSRDTYGPVIEKGRIYHLSVDSAWKDYHGHFLKNEYSKHFFVNKEDRKKPDTRLWKLVLPEPFTLDPLTVEFGEAMDLATSQKAFTVLTIEKVIIRGITEISEDQRNWRFMPESQWKPGGFQLRVLSSIEDLAGNNLNRVFDRDIRADKLPPSDQEFYWIDFEVSLAK